MYHFRLVCVLLLFVFGISLFPKKSFASIKNIFINLKKQFNKQLLITSIISTTCFMLAAHMYAYLNGPLLFDNCGLGGGTPEWHAITDRWLINIYWFIDLGLNLSWFSGLIAIFVMIISVYFISDAFRIKSKLGIIIIAGIFSTHTAVITQHEYTGRCYYGIIALMWASVAAWILTKKELKLLPKSIVGILFIIFSAATYGAYVSIVPTMMLFVLLENIKNGEDSRKTLRQAVIYLIQFIAAMGLYYLIFRLLYHFFGVPIAPYMGKEKMASVSIFSSMFRAVPAAYKTLINYYLALTLYLPKKLAKTQCALLIIGGIIWLVNLYSHRNAIKKDILNVLLFIGIIILLPLAINLIYVMASGQIHFLMIFTYCMPLVFFIKQGEEIIYSNNGLKINVYFKKIVCVSSCLMFIFLYYSVVMSNAVHVHYKNMFDVALSEGTNIIDRIENCEGFTGNEEIILVGHILFNDYYTRLNDNGTHGAEILDACLGPSRWNVNAFTYNTLAKRFLENILQSSLNIATSYDINDVMFVKDMPLFPLPGSVQKIDDKIYVKFSELTE